MEDARKTADSAASVAQKRLADSRIKEEAQKAAIAAKRALDTAKSKIAAAARAPEQGSSQGPGRPAMPAPRPAASCPEAGTRVSTPGWYIVRRGDSLWRIADMHYGNGWRFRDLQKANQKRWADLMIHPCQRIYVP